MTNISRRGSPRRSPTRRTTRSAGLIVSLELPPGAVIDERELMERLGIGRTPVREALRRLAQERLVEVFPRRGMFVTGVDVRDLARLSRCGRCSSPRRRGSRPSARPTRTATELARCSSELATAAATTAS